MMESAFHQLGKILAQGLGLSSPFCPLYLLPAFGIALFWLSRSQSWTVKEAWQYLWLESRRNRRSIGTDSLWALFQMLILRAPLAALQLVLFQWAYESIVGSSAERSWGFALHPFWEAFLGTVLTMLAIDFAAYIMHRALHDVPGLWWIHRLHHAAEFLTPFSTLRQNPLEPCLLNGARAVAAGAVLGLLHLCLPNETPIFTIAGMGPGFFLYMFTVNLHHAPLPIRYPRWLRRFLISPHIHHIHHSRAPEHHGKNFGVIFSFWDLWFGTYWDQEVGLGELEFGVEA